MNDESKNGEQKYIRVRTLKAEKSGFSQLTYEQILQESKEYERLEDELRLDKMRGIPHHEMMEWLDHLAREERL